MPAAQLHAEGLLSLTAFAARLGVARTTVLRWVLHGAKKGGRAVRLEATTCPGGRATTMAAYHRFCDALDAAGRGEKPPEPATPAARRRACDRAKQELRKAGWM